ncbi:hypothetical protein BT69DRAFT_1354336 [Atractiella rhizophila]|nr:hypothetical protein BT69DRAFT_1354336 [Atractiella rhizophila]
MVQCVPFERRIYTEESKRHKTSKACDLCRQRKRKCKPFSPDSPFPCQTCVQMGKREECHVSQRGRMPATRPVLQPSTIQMQGAISETMRTSEEDQRDVVQVQERPDEHPVPGKLTPRAEQGSVQEVEETGEVEMHHLNRLPVDNNGTQEMSMEVEQPEVRRYSHEGRDQHCARENAFLLQEGERRQCIGCKMHKAGQNGLCSCCVAKRRQRVEQRNRLVAVGGARRMPNACARCRTRKIRCEFVVHPDLGCTECRRANQPCVPTEGRKSKKKKTESSQRPCVPCKVVKIPCVRKPNAAACDGCLESGLVEKCNAHVRPLKKRSLQRTEDLIKPERQGFGEGLEVGRHLPDPIPMDNLDPLAEWTTPSPSPEFEQMDLTRMRASSWSPSPSVSEVSLVDNESVERVQRFRPQTHDSLSIRDWGSQNSLSSYDSSTQDSRSEMSYRGSYSADDSLSMASTSHVPYRTSYSHENMSSRYSDSRASYSQYGGTSFYGGDNDSLISGSTLHHDGSQDTHEGHSRFSSTPRPPSRATDLPAFYSREDQRGYYSPFSHQTDPSQDAYLDSNSRMPNIFDPSQTSHPSRPGSSARPHSSYSGDRSSVFSGYSRLAIRDESSYGGDDESVYSLAQPQRLLHLQPQDFSQPQHLQVQQPPLHASFQSQAPPNAQLFSQEEQHEAQQSGQLRKETTPQPQHFRRWEH